MATYAAMIEIMDSGIGKVIQTLKDKGMYEHTLFLFMSDNGSTSEGGFIKQLMADLSNTPYRSYKQWVFQGGTSSPLILTDGRSKSQTEKGSICREPSHIIDIFSHLPGYCFRTLPRHVSQSKSEIGRNQSPAGYTKTENTAARSFL